MDLGKGGGGEVNGTFYSAKECILEALSSGLGFRVEGLGFRA